jgi:hypothetical protein
VVRVDQICQIGDHLYIRFSVHNRARDLFTLASVEVLGMEMGAESAVESVVRWQDEQLPRLGFDDKANAVAVVPAAQGSALAVYALRVTESAGKKRTVLLKGIGF